MAIGFPASSKWDKSFNVEPTLLRQLVRQAVERLDWNYESRDAETIIAHVRANVQSWGETVTITVDGSGNIDAESRCAMPAQIFDWGKNRANLNEFHAALLSVIRNSELNTSAPFRSVDKNGATPLERAIRSTDSDS